MNRLIPRTLISRHRALARITQDKLLKICILSLLLLVAGGSLILVLTLQKTPKAHAAAGHRASANSYIDAVIALDNVSQIAVHDPNGDRYPAAQLFVDLAPQGDQIGTLQISSSQNPAQVPGYHGLTYMDSSGKSALKGTLTPKVFGPVVGIGRTDIPAYITPVLQTAGKMLSGSPAGNRRYVIIVTDAVALSGDQNDCPQALSLHKWFCAVNDLEQQGVSVVLIGFTKPGSEADLIPTKNYIEAHGGIVLQVEDGAGLARRLALAYTDLLTRIHSTMFSAAISGTPDSLSIDPRAQLTGVTFVALGETGVSLASLLTPSGEHVAGRNNSDGSFYASAPLNSGYWLESVNSGNVGGIWHLTPGSTAPTDIFVIAISAAHFDLLNPAPADPASDVSVRYVPSQGPIVLRASVTDTSGGSLATVPFTANPLFDPVSFASNTLPGHNASVVDAVVRTNGTPNDTLQVSLGNQLLQGVFFTKSFHIQARSELGSTQLTVPASTLLAPGASIQLNAQGAANDPAVTTASLTIYGRDPAPGSPWQLIASGGTGASGGFTLVRGCGITYAFIAIDEISGQEKNGQYDYISFDEGSYRSELQQAITGQAALPSSTYLEWWSSQTRWTVTFTSSACSSQSVALGLALHGNGFSAPPIAVVNKPGYSTTNGAAVFTVASNTKTSVQISANVDGCPLSPFVDHTASFELMPISQPVQGGPILQAGAWQAVVACPSGVTNAKRYWQVTALSFFLFTVFFSRMWQRFLSLFNRPYLQGKIEFMNETSDPLDAQGRLYSQTSALIPVSIPRWRRLPVWYLDSQVEGASMTYRFEPHESAFSLLKFALMTEEGGRQITVEATRYATGEKTPMFQIVGLPIGQSPLPCDGEPIVIGQDIVFPDIRVVPDFT